MTVYGTRRSAPWGGFGYPDYGSERVGECIDREAEREAARIAREESICKALDTTQEQATVLVATGALTAVVSGPAGASLSAMGAAGYLVAGALKWGSGCYK